MIHPLGIGNLHGNLTKISISRLESLNDLAENQLNKNDLSWLNQALAKGSKQDALAGLENYFSQNHIDKISLLMQRYIIVDIINLKMDPLFLKKDNHLTEPPIDDYPSI